MTAAAPGGPPADASDAFERLALRAAVSIRRRLQRGLDLAAAGDGEPVPLDDVGRPLRATPAWAHLVHPLAACAIAVDRIGTSREGDRTLWTDGATAFSGLRCEHELVVGTVAIDRLRVDATENRVTLTIPGPLPETVLAAAAGLPLSALVELPSCGLDDVDAAVAALVLEAAETRGGVTTVGPPAAPTALVNQPLSTTFAIAPTRWLRAGPDPVDVDPRYDVEHPHLA